MSSSHNSDLQSAMLHVSGRGISPVPNYGGGWWDRIKGAAKQVYNFASPIVSKHAKNFARDVVSGLGQKLSEGSAGGRLITI